MQFTVECQKRAEGTKPNALRRSGLIPAVLYGHKGTESIALTVKAKTVETLLKKAEVNNTLIDLNITDIDWSGKTIIREVQSHPWKGHPYHVSFFAVAEHGSIDLEVPLHFEGEAVGVKKDGGILDILITTLKVKCTPDNIVDAINVDISQLKVGDSLHINQLNMPEGVVSSTDPQTLVVTVVPPQKGRED